MGVSGKVYMAKKHMSLKPLRNLGGDNFSVKYRAPCPSTARFHTFIKHPVISEDKPKTEAF